MSALDWVVLILYLCIVVLSMVWIIRDLREVFNAKEKKKKRGEKEWKD